MVEKMGAGTEDEGRDDAALKALLGRARRHPSPSAAARERAFAAVQAEWRASVGSSVDSSVERPRRRTSAFALAAGVAALSIAGGLAWRVQQGIGSPLAVAEVVAGSATIDRPWWRGGDAPLTGAARVVRGERLITAPGAVAGLRLSAGLGLRLAPGSRLRFDGPEAATLEAGTVFVDSDPRLGRAPLRIVTPHGIVSHLGTQYALTLQGEGLEVAVREGEVAVALGAGTQRAASGELLRIGAGSAIVREAIAPTDPRWAWIARAPAPLEIDGRPLGDFLYWYSRETGTAPRFADQDAAARLGAVALHGSVAGLAPERALEVVAASVGLAVTRDAAGALTLAER